MDKKAVLKIIGEFRKFLELDIQVKSIILYGSFAAGTNTESSDIDLVVISDDFTDKTHWERVKILSEAIYKVFKPIEATALTTKEWEKGDSIIIDFAKKGEIIKAA